MDKSPSRVRRLMLAAAAAASLMSAWAPPALAQTFPDRPVKIVVPTSAGGQTDNYARALAQELGKAWNQPVIVDNKPGANTIVGATYVAQAPADGYTILLANDPTLSSNQYLYTKLSYDPVKDFVPVVNMVESVQVLVVESSHPAQSLQQLLDMAKAKPDALNYGSWGEGSIAHMDMEKLKMLTGLKMTHVPFRGASEVITAVMGKQVDALLSGVTLAMPGLKSGRLRALALAGPIRSPLLPNVPTFAEAGLKDFESRAWFGLAAPAATPRAVVDKIAADTLKIIRRPDFADKHVQGVGYMVIGQGPDEFDQFLRKDRAGYAKRIAAMKLKLQ
jgi:tripartite-type tricarboxylate transporter receptor subunit TctC